MNKGGLGSLAVHLTNVAVQKTEQGYDKDAGCKWDLRQLKTYMTSRHGSDEVGRATPGAVRIEALRCALRC